jgi:hypothetical protein
MTQEKWTPETVARTLINPRYCLGRPPVVSEEQWIDANVKLIDQMGAPTYLATLLSVLRNGYGTS